jgi:outer membrane protein assembly factor BamB
MVGGASSNCLACDIDGDGREEFLYADGKFLKAVRNGKVVWEECLSTSITQLAIADVDGDGASEILAGAEDGKLYCIDE